MKQRILLLSILLLSLFVFSCTSDEFDQLETSVEQSDLLSEEKITLRERQDPGTCCDYTFDYRVLNYYNDNCCRFEIMLTNHSRCNVSIYQATSKGGKKLIANVPGGATVKKKVSICNQNSLVITMETSSGEVCGSFLLTCPGDVNVDEDCCDDLEYEVCLVFQDENCLYIDVSLAEDCAGASNLTNVGSKNGTASVVAPNRVKVCKTNFTVNDNVGISISFKTENCGFYHTGFFYPFRLLSNGELPSCF